MINEHIVFVAPSFESVQHQVTKFDETNKPLETSLHSDVSLMMRINQLSLSARQIDVLKNQLQPIIDRSNLRSEFETAFGKLTDDDLIKSCPSRYLQTASEQKDYLKTLSEEHSAEQKKLAQKAKEQEEKDKIAREDEEFRAALSKIFKD